MWIGVITLVLAGAPPIATPAVHGPLTAPTIIEPLAHRDPPDDTVKSASQTHA